MPNSNAIRSAVAGRATVSAEFGSLFVGYPAIITSAAILPLSARLLLVLCADHIPREVVLAGTGSGSEPEEDRSHRPLPERVCGVRKQLISLKSYQTFIFGGDIK